MPELRRNDAGQLIYEPDGPMLARFLVDRSHVSVIRGPLGSGKSKAWCHKVFNIACEQAPSPVDGLRRTRWAVVRNTYSELRTTTIKTWLDTFPEELYGRFIWSAPMAHNIRVGDVHVEVIFLALDKPEDVSKLRSLELTGLVVNELQYIPREIFDEGESRTGRFPAVKDGGPTWNGVLADMNEPDEDHFIPLMRGEVAPPEGADPGDYQWPKEWAYFLQPPALIEVFGPDGKTVVGYEENPKAENRRWLLPGFYLDKTKGKPKAWIDSRLMNRINLYVEGEPVHPQFRRETHVAQRDLVPLDGYPVCIGMDFGRSPAALFFQRVNRRYLILDELIGFNEGQSVFAPKLRDKLNRDFRGMAHQGWGDPKGADKGQATEQSAYDILRAHGLDIRPAIVPGQNGNAIAPRLEAVDNALVGLEDGFPRVLISPKCRTLIAGLAGKYAWRKDDEGKREPTKNRWSHICDALQYGLIGEGEARVMTGRPPVGTFQPARVMHRKSLRRA